MEKDNQAIFEIRPLKKSDLTSTYFMLFARLRYIDVSEMVNSQTKIDDFFMNYFNSRSHYIYVIEATHNGIVKLVGSGTVIIEEKFIHNFGKVAHIEDIVIDAEFRKYGLGRKLIQMLVSFSKNKNCYKVILDCSEHNTGFYEKCGFQKHGVKMAHYF